MALDKLNLLIKLILLGLLIFPWFLVLNSCLLFAQDTSEAEINKFPKIFIVASSNNFPPLNMLDDKGDLIGFGRELSDAVIMAINGKTEHIHSPIWVNTLKWLDSRKADFIHDTGYTKDRDKYLDYSDPIIEMPEVIFVRSDRYDITGFDSLKNKKVGCIRKHITHLYLQQFPEINCVIAETPMQGILDLISKKTDAFIYPKQIVLYLTQNVRLEDKIKITGEEMRTLSWSMVVKEGNKEMLSLLNRGLATIRQSGEYERIYNKWFGQRLLFGYSIRDLVTITITATGISITTILLIGFLFYSRRMNKSKNRLKISYEELKYFIQANQLAYNEIWDGDFY